jgi:hypothetical protein
MILPLVPLEVQRNKVRHLFDDARFRSSSHVSSGNWEITPTVMMAKLFYYHRRRSGRSNLCSKVQKIHIYMLKL